MLYDTLPTVQHPSKILPPRRRNPRLEHQTRNRHINRIKRIHNRLHPILIHIREKLPYRLLRRRARRVKRHAIRAAAARATTADGSQAGECRGGLALFGDAGVAGGEDA